MRTAMLLHIDSFDALEQRIALPTAQEVDLSAAGRWHTRLGPRINPSSFHDKLACWCSAQLQRAEQSPSSCARKSLATSRRAAARSAYQPTITVSARRPGSAGAVIRQLADERADLGARRQPDRGAGATARPQVERVRQRPPPR